MNRRCFLTSTAAATVAGRWCRRFPLAPPRDLVRGGTIGRVVQVIGLGPRRLNKASRPGWFFERAKFGGILCDIGSHQFEQVYIVDESGEYHLDVAGRVGCRFFGEMILDCLDRTERAMTQAHAFKAAERGVRAQEAARRLT